MAVIEKTVVLLVKLQFLWVTMMIFEQLEKMLIFQMRDFAV